MIFFVDKVIKKRSCDMCGKAILPGEKHLRCSSGPGRYSVIANVCKRCLWRTAFKLVFNIDIKLPERNET